MGSQYIVRDCRLVYIYLFVVGNNNIIKEIIMNSLFLFIIFLVSINIDSFSKDTKSCKCQIINEFMDNMEIKYIVGNRFTKDLSCLESRILDKADIATTYCCFILEIHEMNIRKRTAKLVAKNFSSNRYSTVYVRAFFKKKRSKWRLKSVYMDFVKR